MDFVIRSYRHGEEQFAANLHKRLYQEEYSWGPSFTDYAVKIALDFAAKPKSSKEDLFVADENGTLIGCIMLCQTEDPEVGQLRLFAVEKEYRRYGVGKALMSALMEMALSAGYRRLILWTASPLTAAIHYYEKVGFRITEAVENSTWSTKGETLQEIKMEMDLGTN